MAIRHSRHSGVFAVLFVASLVMALVTMEALAMTGRIFVGKPAHSYIAISIVDSAPGRR